VEKAVHPAERKQGWWLLGTGLGAMVTGAGIGVWGFSGIGDEDVDPGVQAGKVLAGTYAIVGAIYGLYGLIAGIYYVAKNPGSIKVHELDPQQIRIGLDLPGQGLREADLAQLGPARLPAGEERPLIHFSSQRGRWEARLPEGLQLTDASPGSGAPRVAAAPPPAMPAPPTEDVAPAGEGGLVQDLRSQGEACYRARDYPCALRKFERAFALQPSPAMRFNIASALDKLGRAALAIREYRRYLAEAASTASPSATAHIQKRMKTLLPLVGQLHLAVTPAEASVTLDGVPVANLESGPSTGGKHGIVLDPGTYRLDVSHPGYLARSMSVTLTPGELRSLAITLTHATGREDEP